MITVNGYTINEQEFNLACKDLERRKQGQPLTKEDFKAVGTQLVEAKLLLDEAVTANVAVTLEEIDQVLAQFSTYYPTKEDFEKVLQEHNDTMEALEARVKNNLILQKYLSENFISKVEVSDEDAEKYYKANQDKFVKEEQVKACHILFETSGQALAEQTLKELQNGADFTEMALKHSQCPSRENGGDLGYFGKGQMVKEFEKAAFELEAGSLSNIVKTQFGFHIIKVEDKVKGGLSEFDEVREELKNRIKTAMINNNIYRFVEELKSKANVVFGDAFMAMVK